MHPAVELIRRLPLQERLQVVEELWNDILESKDEFPLSESQKQETLRRLEELHRDPSIALSEEEFWESVNRTDG